ncbi:MAG: cell wall-binding repeat-containing protein [Bifidobacterium angulatum]
MSDNPLQQYATTKGNRRNETQNHDRIDICGSRFILWFSRPRRTGRGTIAACALGVPILFTAKKGLSPQALQQVKKIQPSKIIIVGDSNAVSANAERSLKSNCDNVLRVYGATRVETALALYRSDSKFDFMWSNTAIVTTADNYADALSMSAYTYRSSSPIFLVSNNADNAKQIAALKDSISAISSLQAELKLSIDKSNSKSPTPLELPRFV